MELAFSDRSAMDKNCSKPCTFTALLPITLQKCHDNVSAMHNEKDSLYNLSHFCFVPVGRNTAFAALSSTSQNRHNSPKMKNTGPKIAEWCLPENNEGEMNQEPMDNFSGFHPERFFPNPSGGQSTSRNSDSFECGSSFDSIESCTSEVLWSTFLDQSVDARPSLAPKDDPISQESFVAERASPLWHHDDEVPVPTVMKYQTNTGPEMNSYPTIKNEQVVPVLDSTETDHSTTSSISSGKSKTRDLTYLKEAFLTKSLGTDSSSTCTTLGCLDCNARNEKKSTKIQQRVKAPKSSIFSKLLKKCKTIAFNVPSRDTKDPDLQHLPAPSKTDEDISSDSGLLDLANALGISSESLTTDEIAQRRTSIHQKLNNNTITFTVEEEFDIHCRAEIYASTVVPDPECYLLCDSDNPPKLAETFHGNKKNHWKKIPKRKRHLSIIATESEPYYTYCVTPGNGTQLLKPTIKLVELVAHAISESPDGMLQVQHVYLALQNKYPYFQYFDKASQTSWKSSIRHALYQKWFSKINFQTDFINVRGCYWTINRLQPSPKVWQLPTHKEDNAATEESDEDMIDLENSWSEESGTSYDNKSNMPMSVRSQPESHVDIKPVLCNQVSSEMGNIYPQGIFTLTPIEKDEERDIKPNVDALSSPAESGLLCPPDPVLNDINVGTQASTEPSKDTDEYIFGNNADGGSVPPTPASDVETWQGLDSDSVYYAPFTLDPTSSPAMGQTPETLDFYVHVPVVTRDLPFYVALPLDDNVEIFNET